MATITDLYQKYGKPLAQKAKKAVTGAVMGDGMVGRAVDSAYDFVNKNPVASFARDYGQHQIVEPIARGVAGMQVNHEMDKRAVSMDNVSNAMSIASGTASALPGSAAAMAAWNSRMGLFTATAKAIRNRSADNFVADARHGITNPTSLAYDGMDIKNPAAAIIIDTAAGNPKNAMASFRELKNLRKAETFGQGLVTASNAMGTFFNGPKHAPQPMAANVRKNIHPEDMRNMSDFVDYHAGNWRPGKAEEAIGKYESTIRDMARHYGINPEQPNEKLAAEFRKVLDARPGQMFKPNPGNGPGYQMGFAQGTPRVSEAPRPNFRSQYASEPRMVSNSFPLDDPRYQLAEEVNARALEHGNFSRQREEIVSAIGKENFDAMQRTARSKKWARGRTDAANYPVGRVDELTDQYNRATGSELSADEFIEMVHGQPTSGDLKRLRPKRGDYAGLESGGRPTADQVPPMGVGDDFERAMAEKRGKATDRMLNRGAKTYGGEIPDEKLRPPREEAIRMRREAAGEALSYPTKKMNFPERAKAYGLDIPYNRLSKAPETKPIAETIVGQREAQSRYGGRLQVGIDRALRGLSKEERALVSDVAEGLAETADPKILMAADAWKRVAGEVAEHAQSSKVEISAGGVRRPFTPRENYVPHILREDVLKNRNLRDEAVRHLVESGQAANPTEALGLLGEAVKHSNGMKKFGNLERPRLVELPNQFMERDMGKLAQQYIEGSTKRLTQIDFFGKKGEKVMDMIEQARRAGHDPEYLMRLFQQTVNPDTSSKAVKAVTAFNRAKGLDFSFLTNLTQGANTAASYGTGRTLKSYTKTLIDALPGGSRKAQDLAVEAGALVPESILADGAPMDKFSKIVLLPFRKVEQLNRIAAANAGADYAKALADQLRKDPNHAGAIRGLERLGIDVEQVVRRGITLEDVLQGANKGAENTQFLTDPIDIPLGWQSDLGRLITQFKSFTVRQGQFLKNEIVSEAKAGNPMPLVRFLALGTMAGFGADKVKDMLMQRPEFTGEETATDKALGVASRVSRTLGDPITGNLVNAAFAANSVAKQEAKDSPDRFKEAGAIAGATMGPTAGVFISGSQANPGIINAAVESQKISERNKEIGQGQHRGEQPNDAAQPVKRFAANQVPFGNTVANKFFQPDYDGNKSYMSQLTDAVKRGDQGAINEILSKNWGEGANRANALIQAMEYAASDSGKGGKNKVSNASVSGLEASLPSNGENDDGVLDGSYNTYKKINRSNLNEEQKQMLFEKYGVDTETYAKRQKAEKQGKLDEANYSLEADRLKRSEDVEGWLKVTDKEITRLKEHQATLNPDYEMDDIIKLQNKIEDLTYSADKYIGYGGSFTKGGKGGKGKKAKETVGSSSMAQLPNGESGEKRLGLKKARVIGRR